MWELDWEELIPTHFRIVITSSNGSVRCLAWLKDADSWNKGPGCEDNTIVQLPVIKSPMIKFQLPTSWLQLECDVRPRPLRCERYDTTNVSNTKYRYYQYDMFDSSLIGRFNGVR